MTLSRSSACSGPNNRRELQATQFANKNISALRACNLVMLAGRMKRGLEFEPSSTQPTTKKSHNIPTTSILEHKIFSPSLKSEPCLQGLFEDSEEVFRVFRENGSFDKLRNLIKEDCQVRFLQ